VETPSVSIRQFINIAVRNYHIEKAAKITVK